MLTNATRFLIPFVSLENFILSMVLTKSLHGFSRKRTKDSLFFKEKTLTASHET